MNITLFFENYERKELMTGDFSIPNFLYLSQSETSIKVKGKELFGNQIYCMAYTTIKNINNGFYRMLKNDSETTIYIIGADDHINGEIILNKDKLNIQITPVKYNLQKKIFLKKIKVPINEVIPLTIISIKRHKEFCNELIERFENQEDNYSHFPSLKDAYYYQLFPTQATKNQPFPKDTKEKPDPSIYMINPKTETYFPWAPLEDAWEEYKKKNNLKDASFKKQKSFVVEDLAQESEEEMNEHDDNKKKASGHLIRFFEESNTNRVDL